jgi:hypothetical protein
VPVFLPVQSFHQIKYKIDILNIFTMARQIGTPEDNAGR